MELPYNIFPSCLDISPPQGVYAGSDIPNHVGSDGTVLPVWRRLSARAARQRREFGSFKTEWIDRFVTGGFVQTDRSSDGPDQRGGAAQPLRERTPAADHVWMLSGRLRSRTQDAAGLSEVAGTPAATTGWKALCKGSRRWLTILSLNACFLQPSPSPEARLASFKGYPRLVLNLSCYEGLLKLCQTRKNIVAAGGTEILNMGSKLVPSMIRCFENSIKWAHLAKQAGLFEFLLILFRLFVFRNALMFVFGYLLIFECQKAHS